AAQLLEIQPLPKGPGESRSSSVMGDLVLATWFRHVEVVTNWPGSLDPLTRSLIFVVQHHPERALKLQNTQPRQDLKPLTWPASKWFHVTASALEQKGKLEEAIAQLRDNTSPAFIDFVQNWCWAECRRKLVELCRKAGRPQDAAKVEDELRTYLSAGDRD